MAEEHANITVDKPPAEPTPDTTNNNDQNTVEDIAVDAVEEEKAGAEKQKKKTPYINPDRYKTGGPQREKPSADELAERMDKIRIRNEEIKQRRLTVQADEEAFKATQEKEKAKQAATRKIQENINRSREENARRKLDKIAGREWDSGKQAPRDRNPRNPGSRRAESDATKSAGGKGPTPTSKTTESAVVNTTEDNADAAKEAPAAVS